MPSGAEPYTPPPTHAPPPSAAPPSGSPVPTMGAPYNYHLGAGDRLHIIVYGEDTLTGDFSVAGSGLLSFPLIGNVPASGKTVDELQNEIQAALADGYLRDPHVSAQVTTFRPYYIFGEVTKPGEYPYIDNLTVMNAVATAGGFTYRAQHKFVLIKHQDQKVEQRVPLTDQLMLTPGDTIRVVERFF